MSSVVMRQPSNRFSNHLSYIATKADVEAHFNTHGTGEITEIKLMNGFGFIEYKDAMDARDVVPGKGFNNINNLITSYRTRTQLITYSFTQLSTVPISWANA